MTCVTPRQSGRLETQVLIPELATVTRERARAQFRRARRVVLLLAAGVACTSALSPLIVQVLYGPAFSATAPILVGVIIGAAISAVAQLHLAFVLANQPRYRQGLVVLASVVTGLGVLAVAVATAGAPGSAVGYVLMEVCILAGIFTAYRMTLAQHAADGGA